MRLLALLLIATVAHAQDAEVFRLGTKLSVLTSGRMGVGTSVPTSPLHVSEETLAPTPQFLVENRAVTGGSTQAQIGLAAFDGTSVSTFGWVGITSATFTYGHYPNATYLENFGSGGLVLLSDHPTFGKIGFFTGGYKDENEHMRLTARGDLGLGTLTPVHSDGYGSLSLGGFNGGQLSLQHAGADVAYLYSSGTDFVLSAATGDLVLKYNSGAAQAARVRSDGDFAIYGNARLGGRLDQSGVDSSGTPGDVTADAPSGKAAIAAGQDMLTVTDSLCAVASRVMLTWQGDPGQRSWVTPFAGGFVVHLAGKATGDAAFSWEVAGVLP